MFVENKFLEAIKKREYFENFITRSIKCSNAIEGNTLSYAETYSIVFNDESLPLQNVNPRELYEAINLKYAIDMSLSNLDRLDNGLIVKFGDIINRNIKDTSGYRKIQNYINGADFVPPKPELVSSLMSELLYEFDNSEYNVFERIAKFHINFEHIHPFKDGNGRVGRLLINHQLISNNEIPIVIDDSDRIRYFNLIQDYDIDGFVLFIKELQEREVLKMKEYGVY